MFNIKRENTKIEVELSIDNKEWEEGVEKIYQSSKGKYNVEGFRKGHAPRKVIEKTYGDGVFFDDTINYFLEKTMNEIMQENPEYEPVVQPTTEFESFTVDSGLKMKIKFEIVPDFKMCKYTGITVKVPDTKVKESEIEHEIHHLLEDNAKFETVERAVKDGDSAVIDFTGFLNDVEFAGGSATDYTLNIGSHTFIDNFEEQLIGHKKGETVDVNVKFPDDYPAEELKGQKVVFKVVIKEVKEKHIPVLDDKFVSDTTEFETVEEYRKDVSAHIQTMKENEQENEFEYNIRKHLLENTDIQIPQEMVEIHAQHDTNRMVETLKMYGMTLEQYIQRTSGGTVEDYLKSIETRTLESIKSRYIFRKIIEEQNITVSAEELAERTAGMTDERQINSVENTILLEKVYKYLKDNNKVEVDEKYDENYVERH